jgi:hypothetical protein
LFGFRFDVGLDPVQVNVGRMIDAFRRGCRELGEVWEVALRRDTFEAVRDLGCRGNTDSFHLHDELWARVVLDFACAYNRHPLSRGLILRSLTPLYLARVASFVRETETLVASEVEEKVEQLCLTFEDLKPHLIAEWNEDPGRAGSPQMPLDTPVQCEMHKENLEV